MSQSLQLLPSQRSVIYHALIDDDYPETYSVQQTVRFKHVVCRQSIQHACEYIIGRNDILRGFVVYDSIKPKLQINTTATCTLNFLDITKQYVNNPNTLKKIIEQDRKKGFDILKPPLYRFTLIKYTPSECILIWSFHHLLLGGDSMVIMKELLEYYLNLLEGTTTQHYALKPYSDFVSQFYKHKTTAAIDYWHNILQNHKSKYIFRQNRLAKENSLKQAYCPLNLNNKTYAILKEIARKRKIRINILLQSAWSIVLKNHFNCDDVVFGVVRAFPPLITKGYRGPLYHTFPARVKFQQDTLIMDLVNTLIQQNKKMMEYYYSSPTSAQGSGNSQSLHSVMNTIFEFKTCSFENYFKNESGFTELEFDFKVDTGMPLCLEIMEQNESISGRLQYDTRLLNHDYVRNLAQHFLQIISSLTKNIDGCIDDLNMLTVKEKTAVQLTSMGKSSSQAQAPKDLTSYFKRTHRLHAARIMLVEKDRELTYQNIYHRVINLSAHLRQYSSPNTRLIAFYMQEKSNQIIAALAIQHIGAAYVPIDIEWPQNRVAEIIQMCSIEVILCDSNKTVSSQAKQHGKQLQWLNIESTLAHPNTTNWLNEKLYTCEIQPNSLAYIIFTSGTTGAPKGVKVSHANVINTLSGMNHLFELNRHDVVLALSRMTFDLSVYDVFAAISSGMKIVLPTESENNDPSAWLDLMEKNGVTLWNSVPGYLQMLLTYLASQPRARTEAMAKRIRLILLSGDKIDISLLNQARIVFPQTKIICLGGATEGSIWSIFYDADNLSHQHINVPYGQALANQAVFILTKDLKLCGFNIIGEITLAGNSVAQGYLSTNDTDDQRFFTHPALNMRMYLTGDLGYMDNDNNIIIIGRKDHQVKVNGYRIELTEIESVANRLKGITSIAHISDHQKIYLYYTDTNNLYSPEEVLAHCKNNLPKAMLPCKAYLLDNLPLTTNGKIDRSRISKVQPIKEPKLAKGSGLTTSSITQHLEYIFCKVLNINHISLDENYFQIGFDSIQSIEVLVYLNNMFHLNLKLKSLFSCQTISEITILLESYIKEKDEPPINPPNVNFHTALAHNIWLASQSNHHSQSYNIPILISTQKPLCTSKLKSALHAVIANNNIFGNYYVMKQGVLACKFDPNYIDNVNIAPVHTENIDDTSLNYIINKSANIPFNLTEAPLIRVDFFIREKNNNIILVCIHHIIFDQRSVQLFMKELTLAYNDLANYKIIKQKKIIDPPISPYYAYNKNDLSAWIDLLRQAPAATIPATIRLQRKTGSNANAGLITSTLKIDINRFNTFMHENNVTEFMIWANIFNITLSLITNNTEFIIGTPVSCNPADNNTMNMLTNTVPLYFRMDDSRSFSELVATNKSLILESINFSDIPLIDLIKAVNAQHTGNYNPLFRILFVMDSLDSSTFKVKGGVLSQSYANLESTKFDITFYIQKKYGTYSLCFEYNKDLYSKELIDSIVKHFITLTNLLLDHPDEKIHYLLSSKYHNGFSPVLKGEIKPAYLTTSLVDRFNQMAQTYPKKIALYSLHAHYTYASLNIVSNQVANKLNMLCPESPQVISVLVARTPLAIILILAILKSGHIYLPLDPTQPTKRLKLILDDSQAKLIIYDESTIEITNKISKLTTALPRYTCDDIIKSSHNEDVKHLCQQSNSATAYMLYTSGTTGRPKKIEISYKVLTNLILWQKSVNCGCDSMIAQFNALCFDVSIQEIFYALLTGSTLVIIPNSIKKCFSDTVNFIRKHQVNKLFIPTPLLDFFATELVRNDNTFEHLNEIIVSGDQLIITDNIRKMLLSHAGSLILTNHYGPSETHVVTTHSINILKNPLIEIPAIGKPIANTNIILKNSIAGEVMHGFPGEICVQSSQGFYATGDLARIDNNGCLFFLGRSDTQIKNQGYRVNLAEIQLIILQHPQVDKCYIYSNQLHNPNIYAFVVPKDFRTINKSISLQKYLRENLPPSMIPKIIFRSSIPFFSNGKVNTQELLHIIKKDMLISRTTSNFSLNNEILKLFTQVLGLSFIDQSKTFFELGGASFQALCLLQNIEKKFDCKISMDEFFSLSTIESISQRISAMENTQELEVCNNFIVLLKEGTKKIPLVMIHPIGGTIFCFKKLADFFYDDRTIVGIRDPFFSDDHTHSSIAELANAYVYKLLQLFPSIDSFILCGASFGSVVAAEMSVIFNKIGITVPYLGIFDGWAQPPEFLQNEMIFNLISHYDYARNKKQLLNLGIDKTNQYLKLRWLRFQQLKQHKLSIITSPLYLFKAIDEPSLPMLTNQDLHGWDHYTQANIKLIPVPGNHESIFCEPNIYFLTENLIKDTVHIE